MDDRNKPLSGEDLALWRKVTATIKQRKQADYNGQNGPISAPSSKAAAPKRAIISVGKNVQHPPPSVQKYMKNQSAPSFTCYSRREKSRLSRGITKMDGTLDLHGMTQERAYAALENFISRGVANGWKNIHIITGKGSSRTCDNSLQRDDFFKSRPGVLRRVVPQWLSHQPINEWVVGFEPASPSQGGSGALYVRLKKK